MLSNNNNLENSSKCWTQGAMLTSLEQLKVRRDCSLRMWCSRNTSMIKPAWWALKLKNALPSSQVSSNRHNAGIWATHTRTARTQIRYWHQDWTATGNRSSSQVSSTWILWANRSTPVVISFLDRIFQSQINYSLRKKLARRTWME